MSCRALLIPGAVVLVLLGMLLPVPPALLDIFIVLNIVIAVLLLVTALSITDSLKLSALPTILLLCTLFRLSLNVSTTRLILTNGSAGDVIGGFAAIVMGDSIAVGVVIFAIVTLIQFVVIARGAERVAEVSARFTLDAMPGKQMAIDADVRAGLYDLDTARRKRKDLQLESRFYGALDGAMKFVKGDAIASLCVVVINIVGGVLIGVASGHSLADAAGVYTRLTIGDGLASQIPSLLSSLAAGLVVTRVGGADQGMSLGDEVISQFLQSGAVVLFTVVGVFVLAFLPGFPSFALVAVSITLGFLFLMQKKPPGEAPVERKPFVASVPSVVAFQCVGGDSLNEAEMRRIVELSRELVFQRCGLVLPRFAIGWEADDGKQRIVPSIRGIRGVALNPGAAPLQELITDFIVDRRLEFYDEAHARRMLDLLETASGNMAPVIPVHALAEVLRWLAEEGIATRSFDIIIQTVSDAVTRGLSGRAALAETRRSLARVITASVADRGAVVSCCALSPALDARLASCERSRDTLDPAILSALPEAVRSMNPPPRCIVTSSDARRLTWELLSASNLTIPVLAHDELCSDYHIEWGEMINVFDEGAPDAIRLAA